MATTVRTLWIGDKWQIGVRYVKPDGTPFVFSSDKQPAGEMYLGKSSNPPIDFRTGVGNVIVLDQTVDATKGCVLFQIHSADVDETMFKGAPEQQFNRLQALTVDLLGEKTTQSVIQLDVRNPRTSALTGLSFSSEVVQVNGTQVTGDGGTILRFPVTSVSSYSANHAFDHNPEVWAVDAFSEPVEVDFTYGVHQVYFTFAMPFTGTLYLA